MDINCELKVQLEKLFKKSVKVKNSSPTCYGKHFFGFQETVEQQDDFGSNVYHGTYIIRWLLETCCVPLRKRGLSRE